MALSTCGESSIDTPLAPSPGLPVQGIAPPVGTADPASLPPPPKVAVTETRAGGDQHVVLPSRVDGVDVSFQMFEPDNLVAGQTYPLVLEGHGYGGARTETRGGFIARLTAPAIT